MVIQPYLTFNGNCREAMNFYKDCLGGELIFQTIGDSPMADKMPEKLKHYILHSSLTNSNLVIMGSDIVSNEGLQKGNAVTLMLNCDSEEQIRECYKKLSYGGQPTHPLEKAFFGALIGNISDRYGNHWLLHYQETTILRS
jgi:PhnB protein